MTYEVPPRAGGDMGIEFAGVDGCRGGWLCVGRAGPSFHAWVFRSARHLLASFPSLRALAVDIPIGLVEHGDRECDNLARPLLPGRASSVFHAPIRPALYLSSRHAAAAVTHAASNRAVGQTAWDLHPKVIDMDQAITPVHQRWCFEVHPELCFMKMNGGTPMAHNKGDAAGLADREALIDAAFPGARALVQGQLPPQADCWGNDDLNDAFSALWMAERIANGQARTIPELPPVDSRGLRMEMWY